jgi:hypothetical protein
MDRSEVKLVIKEYVVDLVPDQHVVTEDVRYWSPMDVPHPASIHDGISDGLTAMTLRNGIE